MTRHHSDPIADLQRLVEEATGEAFDALWWSNAAPRDLRRHDPGLVTTATTLARAIVGPRWRSARPARYESERRHLAIALDDPAELATTLAELELLYDVVPDPRDPLVRVQLLGLLGPSGVEQTSRWDNLVGLARSLATDLPRPSRLSWTSRHDSLGLDGSEPNGAAVTARIRDLPDERLGSVGLSLFAPGSVERRWHEAYGPVFVRRVALSTGLGKALVVNTVWNEHARHRWERVRAAWDHADQLAGATGLRLPGPLDIAGATLAKVRISDEALERYETSLELAYLAALVAAGSDVGANQRRPRWDAIYRGSADLRDILLLAQAHAGLWVAGRLRLPRRPEGARFLGVEPDEEQLDVETQASLAAFGCAVLAEERYDDYHRAWDLLWTCGLRPRESAPPWPGGRAPVGVGHALFVSAVAGKTGCREAIEVPSATTAIGLSDGWLFERPDGVSEEAWCRAAATRAARACRLVREQWEQAGNGVIAGRTSYFVRHAVADQLRWGLRDRPGALAVALGHLSGVTDAPYTQVSETEQRGATTTTWAEMCSCAGVSR
jgi:hypothetical protein